MCTWSLGGSVPGPRGVPDPGGLYLVLGGVPGPGGCTWPQGVYLVLGRCTWSQGGVPGLGGVPSPGGDVPGPRGVYLVLGGCTWCKGEVYLVLGGVSGQVPPVNRITHTCKNITLPELHCGQ